MYIERAFRLHNLIVLDYIQAPLCVHWGELGASCELAKVSGYIDEIKFFKIPLHYLHYLPSPLQGLCYHGGYS
jgi:hypothetical protein